MKLICFALCNDLRRKAIRIHFRCAMDNGIVGWTRDLTNFHLGIFLAHFGRHTECRVHEFLSHIYAQYSFFTHIFLGIVRRITARII